MAASPPTGSLPGSGSSSPTSPSSSTPSSTSTISTTSSTPLGGSSTSPSITSTPSSSSSSSTPSSTSTTSTTASEALSTNASGVVVTIFQTGPASLATQTPTAHSKSFLQNKGAEAGVFTVVGLVGLGLVALILIQCIQRRRARKLDQEIAAAAAEANAQAAMARIPDEYDDDPRMRGAYNRQSYYQDIVPDQPDQYGNYYSAGPQMTQYPGDNRPQSAYYANYDQQHMSMDPAYGAAAGGMAGYAAGAAVAPENHQAYDGIADGRDSRSYSTDDPSSPGGHWAASPTYPPAQYPPQSPPSRPTSQGHGPPTTLMPPAPPLPHQTSTSAGSTSAVSRSRSQNKTPSSQGYATSPVTAEFDDDRRSEGSLEDDDYGVRKRVLRVANE